MEVRKQVLSASRRTSANIDVTRRSRLVQGHLNPSLYPKNNHVRGHAITMASTIKNYSLHVVSVPTSPAGWKE